MNPTEIIAAIEAAEAALPLIEKSYSDMKVVMADVENALVNIKSKLAIAKTMAAAPPPASPAA